MILLLTLSILFSIMGYYTPDVTGQKVLTEYRGKPLSEVLDDDYKYWITWN